MVKTMPERCPANKEEGARSCLRGRKRDSPAPSRGLSRSRTRPVRCRTRSPHGHRLARRYAFRVNTADTALRLGRYFGTSPQFWLGLQMDYDLDTEEDRLGEKLQHYVREYAASG